MTSTSPWRDYARSRAVLLGAWDYTQLRPVPAARKSLDRMVGLLTGRLCGWPADHVLTLRNIAERGSVPDQLMQVFDGVTDVALFYFVGHGQLHGDELCLALRESPKNGARRLTTGLPFSDVRAALRECDARTKIVILDCCFSGTATLPQHTLAATAADEDNVDVIDKASGTGAFTMAASGAYQTAWHEPDQSTHAPETFFTKYLIDTVEQGVPDHPEDLSLRVIFDRTATALARDRRPQPTRSVRDDADRFLLARNAAMLPPTPAKRSTQRQLRLRSPSPITTLDATASTQVRPNATPPTRADTYRSIPERNPARRTYDTAAEPSIPRPTDPEHRTSPGGYPSQPIQPPGPAGQPPAHPVVFGLTPSQRGSSAISLSLGLIMCAFMVARRFVSPLAGLLQMDEFGSLEFLFFGIFGIVGITVALVAHLRAKLVLTQQGVRLIGLTTRFIRWGDIKAVRVGSPRNKNQRCVRLVLGDRSTVPRVPLDGWGMRDRQFDEKVQIIQQWHACFGSPEPWWPERGRKAR